MRPENERMRIFLAQNGIKARVKYISTGSLKGCWRLSQDQAYRSGANVPWTMELADNLTRLGFANMQGEPLGQYDGNGGM